METSSDASWELDWDGAYRLVLVIRGQHDPESASQASERFASEAKKGSFELVVDLTEMTGYAREARQAWTTVLKDHRGAIELVHFVGLGPIFRMAAATVTLAAGIAANFHETREELASAPSPRAANR